MIAESRLYTIYMAHSLLSGRKNNTHEIRIWHKNKTSEWYYNIDVWVNLGYAQHARWKKNEIILHKKNFFKRYHKREVKYIILFRGFSFITYYFILALFSFFLKMSMVRIWQVICANVVREYIIEKKEEFLHPPVRYEKK